MLKDPEALWLQAVNDIGKAMNGFSLHELFNHLSLSTDHDMMQWIWSMLLKMNGCKMSLDFSRIDRLVPQSDQILPIYVEELSDIHLKYIFVVGMGNLSNRKKSWRHCPTLNKHMDELLDFITLSREKGVCHSELFRQFRLTSRRKNPANKFNSLMHHLARDGFVQKQYELGGGTSPVYFAPEFAPRNMLGTFTNGRGLAQCILKYFTEQRSNKIPFCDLSGYLKLNSVDRGIFHCSLLHGYRAGLHPFMVRESLKRLKWIGLNHECNGHSKDNTSYELCLSKKRKWAFPSSHIEECSPKSQRCVSYDASIRVQIENAIRHSGKDGMSKFDIENAFGLTASNADILKDISSTDGRLKVLVSGNKNNPLYSYKEPYVKSQNPKIDQARLHSIDGGSIDMIAAMGSTPSFQRLDMSDVGIQFVHETLRSNRIIERRKLIQMVRNFLKERNFKPHDFPWFKPVILQSYRWVRINVPSKRFYFGDDYRVCIDYVVSKSVTSDELKEFANNLACNRRNIKYSKRSFLENYLGSMDEAIQKRSSSEEEIRADYNAAIGGCVHHDSTATYFSFERHVVTDLSSSPMLLAKVLHLWICGVITEPHMNQSIFTTSDPVLLDINKILPSMSITTFINCFGIPKSGRKDKIMDSVQRTHRQVKDMAKYCALYEEILRKTKNSWFIPLVQRALDILCSLNVLTRISASSDIQFNQCNWNFREYPSKPVHAGIHNVGNDVFSFMTFPMYIYNKQIELPTDRLSEHQVCSRISMSLETVSEVQTFWNALQHYACPHSVAKIPSCYWSKNEMKNGNDNNKVEPQGTTTMEYDDTVRFPKNVLFKSFIIPEIYQKQAWNGINPFKTMYEKVEIGKTSSLKRNLRALRRRKESENAKDRAKLNVDIKDSNMMKYISIAQSEWEFKDWIFVPQECAAVNAIKQVYMCLDTVDRSVSASIVSSMSRFTELIIFKGLVYLWATNVLICMDAATLCDNDAYEVLFTESQRLMKGDLKRRFMFHPKFSGMLLTEPQKLSNKIPEQAYDHFFGNFRIEKDLSLRNCTHTYIADIPLYESQRPLFHLINAGRVNRTLVDNNNLEMIDATWTNEKMQHRHDNNSVDMNLLNDIRSKEDAGMALSEKYASFFKLASLEKEGHIKRVLDLQEVRYVSSKYLTWWSLPPLRRSSYKIDSKLIAYVEIVPWIFADKLQGERILRYIIEHILIFLRKHPGSTLSQLLSEFSVFSCIELREILSILVSEKIVETLSIVKNHQSMSIWNDRDIEEDEKIECFRVVE